MVRCAEGGVGELLLRSPIEDEQSAVIEDGMGAEATIIFYIIIKKKYLCIYYILKKNIISFEIKIWILS
jgi:hypothetical protein